jgi:phage gp46-like protein
MEFLLQDKGDGGEFSLAGGDIKNDGTFFTAVYLSLFNGDAFYNVYSEHKTDQKLEEFLSLPVTSANLKKVEQAGQNALKWLIDENIAKETSVFAYGDITEKINVEITITEPDGEDCKFAIVWQNEKLVLKRG